jgi:hypothetical protein
MDAQTLFLDQKWALENPKTPKPQNPIAIKKFIIKP